MLHARMGNGSNNNHTLMMCRPTNIIIWNISGGNNNYFCITLGKWWILTNLATFLETRMENHITLSNDFLFTEKIEVPLESQARRMVIMLDASIVRVHDFVRRNQEIHATVEVTPFNTAWLFSSVYASTNLDKICTLWNNIENIHKNNTTP